MSCTWYAIFVTENYEKWITRIIMYSWCTIHVYHCMHILINIWWIINNYKSYQKNHLIMHILMIIYNHTNLYMFQLVAVHFMSDFCKNTKYYWWELYIWEIYLEQYITTTHKQKLIIHIEIDIHNFWNLTASEIVSKNDHIQITYNCF